VGGRAPDHLLEEFAVHLAVDVARVEEGAVDVPEDEHHAVTRSLRTLCPRSRRSRTGVEPV
jgi:hypothetical protein